MGVKISEIIPKREIKVETLAGKVLAVDSHNIIYQFLTTIRDRETGEPFHDSHGSVTSHLSGIFYRFTNLMQHGLKFIFVFDGKKPEFKEETIEERKRIKIEAQALLKKAVEENDYASIKRYGGASAYITKEIIEEAKTLLEVMGIPCIQGPSEGEAQAAVLTKGGDAYAVISQDMDTLLFGSPRLVRNLSTTGRRKMPQKNVWVKVEPELIELNALLQELKINREQLITMGILIGTDYNVGGVKGIGPVNALKLVKEYKTLEEVMKHVGWPYTIEAMDIFNFFIKPPVEEKYRIEFKKPDFDGIRKLLIDKHDFSDERVNSTLEKFEGIKKQKQQSSLGSWLKR